MADSLGWRWAFYLVVPPGLILGALCMFMQEPARGAADAVAARTPRVRDMAVFLDIPSFMLNTLAMTSMTFAFGGVATWMPTYLYERTAVYAMTPAAYANMRKPTDPGVQPLPDEIIAALQPLEGREYQSIEPFRAALSEVLVSEDVVRLRTQIAEAARDKERSISTGKVNGIFGGIVVLAGIMATLSGGYLADRLRNKVRGSYFLVSGIGMIVGLPMFLLAIQLPVGPAWIFVFLAVFFLFFNTGPSNTALANVAPPALRSSAFALNILIIHLVGDVISPPIVGWIDDRSSLRLGMFFLAAPILLAGFFWLWGSRYLDRDTALAPTRIGGTT